MFASYHLFVTLPIYILFSLGLFGLFKKAGEDSWKAFVPVLNVLVMLKITGRPTWWVALFLIPILNLIIGMSVCLDIARSFNKHKFWEHVLSALFPFFYFPFLGFNKTDTYMGQWAELAKDNPIKKSEGREWADAILFAGTAALIIRSFMIEAFMIPTTSMEGSLLAGDFLFVSKMHYGVRMPMVPLSLPFIHNKIPGTNAKSYLDFFTLPYSRLPAFKDVERYDIVVFNYPGDDAYPDVPELGPIKEISMKQNYIKRCVAIAGDTLEIKDLELFINGEKAWKPDHLQFQYSVVARYGIPDRVLDELGFRYHRTQTHQNDNAIAIPGGQGHYAMFMNDKTLENIKNHSEVQLQQIQQKLDKRGEVSQVSEKSMIYPKNLGAFPWNTDNFGPLWVPKKGATIELTPENVILYERCITAYEGHTLKNSNGKISIDNKETSTYTFEMDYYFMMGDNRHASLDSRFWGFVPEDHIVGRPLMVMMSFEDGFRGSRFFSPVTRWEP